MWERKHRANIALYERRIRAIYEAATKEAAAIGASIDRPLGDELFDFSKFPTAQKRIDELMKKMYAQTRTVIVNGVRSEWTLANNKNDELCRMVFGDNIGRLTQSQYRRYFTNNLEALDAFIARKENGLDLSDRVWEYTNMYKKEIELGLDVGIRNGRSADELSRDLRDYLQHPDKLFRRVRDEHGMLVLSAAAAAFHPGRGVYRSSYMNARRLAATETNIAYRTADYDRYQQLDFVVGIEVHLSKNHNCKGVPAGQFYDICDELQGKYPKEFKFVGWHPLCRCYVTSILKTEKEMDEDDARIMRGEEPTEGSVNSVTTVPEGFTKWVEDNSDRIARAKSLPYFLRDNGTMKGGEWVMNTFMEVQRKEEKIVRKAVIKPYIPSGVTSEQRIKQWSENSKAVSKKLGVSQGEQMSFDEADEMKGNPHYVERSASGYTVNCQSCVVAYELRRRGFDVEAMMNTLHRDNIPYKLSKKTELVWIDPFTNKTPVKINCNELQWKNGGWKGNTITQITREIEAVTKAEGRYHIDFCWKGGKSGHIITIERKADGTLLFYDPQTGKIVDWKKMSKDISTSRGVNVLRVDKLFVNTDYVECVAKAGTTKASTIRYAEKTSGWHGEKQSVDLLNNLKKRRAEIKKEAKVKLRESVFRHPEIEKSIKIYGSGIDEWLNQPHVHLLEKNELLLNIGEVLEKSKFMGRTLYKGKESLIFEIEIGGEKSWIIVNNAKGRGLGIYSVSDSPTVLKNIQPPT